MYKITKNEINLSLIKNKFSLFNTMSCLNPIAYYRRAKRAKLAKRAAQIAKEKAEHDARVAEERKMSEQRQAEYRAYMNTVIDDPVVTNLKETGKYSNFDWYPCCGGYLSFGDVYNISFFADRFSLTVDQFRAVMCRRDYVEAIHHVIYQLDKDRDIEEEENYNRMV